MLRRSSDDPSVFFDEDGEGGATSLRNVEICRRGSQIGCLPTPWY